jgi:hypothetical protein
MADINTFQTLKITADGFSFGLRYTLYLLILFVIAVSFSTMAIAIPSPIRWFFAAFAVVAVIALPAYLKRVQQNNWKPEWGANRKGLIIGMESSLDVLTVAWEDVRFIKLMEYFGPKIKHGTDADVYRKAVLIGVRDDMPANAFEKVVFHFHLPYGLPRNVILKSYSGASQDKVIDLLLSFMPFTLPFEKIDEPFTKGLRFQPKLSSEEGIEA